MITHILTVSAMEYSNSVSLLGHNLQVLSGLPWSEKYLMSLYPWEKMPYIKSIH